MFLSLSRVRAETAADGVGCQIRHDRRERWRRPTAQVGVASLPPLAAKCAHVRRSKMTRMQDCHSVSWLHAMVCSELSSTRSAFSDELLWHMRAPGLSLLLGDDDAQAERPRVHTRKIPWRPRCAARGERPDGTTARGAISDLARDSSGRCCAARPAMSQVVTAVYRLGRAAILWEANHHWFGSPTSIQAFGLRVVHVRANHAYALH
jgi:hypothetical protein